MVKYGFIINHQMKAKTIAELKQYDLSFLHNDLWVVSKTLTTLASNDKTVERDYLENREERTPNNPIWFRDNPDLWEFEYEGDRIITLSEPEHDFNKTTWGIGADDYIHFK